MSDTRQYCSSHFFLAPMRCETPTPLPIAAREGERESGLSVSLISLYRSPLFCFSSDLKIFRPRRPLTHDLFSRAWPVSVRKSLIFLDRVSAVPAAVSDNAHSVNVASEDKRARFC